MKKITLLLFATLLFLIPTANAQVSSFSDDFSGGLTNWSTYSAGASTTTGWYSNGNYARHYDDNPADGSAVDNYLISPLLDLSSTAGAATLTYREIDLYGGSYYYTNGHSVVYSTDYNGSNASSATWTEIQEGAATGSWVNQSLSVPITATAFAFRYQGDYSDTWIIDDVVLTPAASCGDPTDFVAT